MQGGRIIKYNIPIESHAAQIYTRNMFDKFCDLIFESGYFIASEIIPQMKYKVRHIRAEKREKWEKVEFNIDVTCNGEQYICECGLPEHMGMLCPHIIRVSNLCDCNFVWQDNIIASLLSAAIIFFAGFDTIWCR